MTHTGRLCSLRQVAGAAMAGMLLASGPYQNEW